MKTETLENINAINSIGTFSKTICKDVYKFNLKDYLFWLIGVGMSLLPIIVFSIYPLIDNTASPNYNFVYNILKDVSILFVCISMSISALNYAVSKNNKHHHIYMSFSLLIIVFAAMLYAYVRGLSSYNEGIIAKINVIYFTLELFICTTVYIRRK